MYTEYFREQTLWRARATKAFLELSRLDILCRPGESLELKCVYQNCHTWDLLCPPVLQCLRHRAWDSTKLGQLVRGETAEDRGWQSSSELREQFLILWENDSAWHCFALGFVSNIDLYEHILPMGKKLLTLSSKVVWISSSLKALDSNLPVMQILWRCSVEEWSLPSYPMHTGTPVWFRATRCLKFTLILKKKPKF